VNWSCADGEMTTTTTTAPAEVSFFLSLGLLGLLGVEARQLQAVRHMQPEP